LSAKTVVEKRVSSMSKKMASIGRAIDASGALRRPRQDP